MPFAFVIRGLAFSTPALLLRGRAGTKTTVQLHWFLRARPRMCTMQFAITSCNTPLGGTPNGKGFLLSEY